MSAIELYPVFSLVSNNINSASSIFYLVHFIYTRSNFTDSEDYIFEIFISGNNWSAFKRIIINRSWKNDVIFLKLR